MLGVEGSVRQGCAVDWTPTDLQNGPTNGGVVSTHLSIKLLSLASLRLADALGKLISASALGLATSTCHLPMYLLVFVSAFTRDGLIQHHQSMVMFHG